MAVNRINQISGLSFLFSEFIVLVKFDTVFYVNMEVIEKSFKYIKRLIKFTTRFYLILLFSGLFSFPLTLLAQQDLGFKQKGLNHLRQGEYIEALENLNIAIQLEPSVPELFYLRGYAKYCLDDYYGAERDYTISIELSPFLSDVFVNRAVVRSQQQNFKGAFEDYSFAQQMDSSNIEIYTNRARTFLFLKKYYACLWDCNKAIQLNDSLEGIYIIKGSAEIGLERYDNAIANLSRAIEINPLNPFSYTQRGLVWLEKNQFDSALRDLSLAIRVDSNNSYALFNRSFVRSKKADLKGALEDLDKVVLLSPYNSYAYFNRAIILIGMNDKKGAIRDFENVSKLDPQNIISYYYRSRLKADLSDFKGALEDLNKTIELFPDYADAYYERFVVKSKLKDSRGAAQDYQHAVTLGEKNRLTPDSLKYRKENYLQQLVKLSGDFEERNTRNTKFQNQYIEIELLPMFEIFLGKASLEDIRLYDVYQRGNYYTNILTLSNKRKVIEDTVITQEWIHLIKQQDTLQNDPRLNFNLGMYYHALKNFELAIKHFADAVSLDSNYIPAYFCLSNTKYKLIEKLISAEDDSGQITITQHSSGLNKFATDTSFRARYKDIIWGYSMAIQLDTGFSFAYYNRGLLNAKQGNYQEAIIDFTMAIHHRGDFSEAFYNRGLLHILLKDQQKGCEDLSHAGELGILDAYKVMKRYCYK